MKASELITKLQGLIIQNGDLEVGVAHPDSGYAFEARAVTLRDLRKLVRFPEDKTIIVISDSDEWM